MESSVCLRILKGHDGIVHCLGIHLENRLLVSGSYDGKLKLWDLDDNSGTGLVTTISTYQMQIFSLIISGQRIVAGSRDGKIFIFDFDP